jgi:hypothetical protein
MVKKENQISKNKEKGFKKIIALIDIACVIIDMFCVTILYLNVINIKDKFNVSIFLLCATNMNSQQIAIILDSFV